VSQGPIISRTSDLETNVVILSDLSALTRPRRPAGGSGLPHYGEAIAFAIKLAVEEA